jgi:hypothetical protein
MHFALKQHFIYTLTLLHGAAFKATLQWVLINYGSTVKIVLSRRKYQIKE